LSKVVLVLVCGWLLFQVFNLGTPSIRGSTRHAPAGEQIATADWLPSSSGAYR
jgi:hypothetical protein